MQTRFKKRLTYHGALFVVSGILLMLFYSFVPGDDQKYLWSMSTGYTSLILVGVTLMIGPLNVIQKKNNPVSSDLRRDAGIWSGLIGLAHVIVGIQVHMGNIWLYFFKAVEGDNSFKLRDDLFGAANYTGLLAAVILLTLLLLSNDLSLRILKPTKWKRLQQFSYVFFALTVAHAIMYQAIEKRIPPFVIALVILSLIPTVVQIRGYKVVSWPK